MDFSRTFAYGAVKNLRPHPLNEKLYGEQKSDKELVESIKTHGVLSPIVVNKKKQILSGHRRWLAAKEAGLTSVPLTGFQGTPTEEELFLIESNRQREKTAEQRGREFKELKRIEADILAQQESERKKAGNLTRTQANLPKSSEARDIAAEKAGLKSRTAEKLEQIVDAADKGNKQARKQLDAINETGRGVDPAHRALFKQKKKEQKSVSHSKADELRKLFSRKVELQAARDDGRFNLIFWKQTEAQVREIAKALA